MTEPTTDSIIVLTTEPPIIAKTSGEKVFLFEKKSQKWINNSPEGLNRLKTKFWISDQWSVTITFYFTICNYFHKDWSFFIDWKVLIIIVGMLQRRKWIRSAKGRAWSLNPKLVTNTQYAIVLPISCKYHANIIQYNANIMLYDANTNATTMEIPCNTKYPNLGLVTNIQGNIMHLNFSKIQSDLNFIHNLWISWSVSTPNKYTLRIKRCCILEISQK